MKSSFKFFSFWLFLALGTVTVLFNSCSKNNDPDNSGSSNLATTDAGVVINGVKWATRNVGASGRFAAGSGYAGMFYKWNGQIIWSATGNVIDWDDSYPTSNTWTKTNDPSPAGWRIPTREEIQMLFDSNKVSNEWTTMNGRNGRKFTDIATGNSLFLPAAGYFNEGDDTLDGVDTGGFYWSSTAREYLCFNAHDLRFLFNFDDWSICYRCDGFSIRSVAENTQHAPR